MMNTITRLRSAAYDGYNVNENPRQYKKTHPNCISCYRWEEGLSLRKLCGILGITSYHSAKDICAAPHSSAKYVQILASREGISVSEFRQRYTPGGEDAA